MTTPTTREGTAQPAQSAMPDLFARCCSAVGCDDVATIVVDVGNQSELPLCGRHWDQIRGTETKRRVRAVLDRPDCFRTACATPAVSVMAHLDGTQLPVCERHLDDLSWISPSAEELARVSGRSDKWTV